MTPELYGLLAIVGASAACGGFISAIISDIRNKRKQKKAATKEAARKVQIPNPLYTLIAGESDPRTVEQEVEKWMRDFAPEVEAAGVTWGPAYPQDRAYDGKYKLARKESAYVHLDFTDEKYISLHLYNAKGNHQTCTLLYPKEKEMAGMTNEERALVVIDRALKQLNTL